MYNAKNYEVSKGMGLPTDTILEGVITKIDDGFVKDFIAESAKKGWKGDIESRAINVEIEVSVTENGKLKSLVKMKQMFTYFDNDGKTGFTSNSNLGKYQEKYHKLPELGDQVKILTDSNGMGKIKLN